LEADLQARYLCAYYSLSLPAATQLLLWHSAEWATFV
jgi:hypothetical protein